jgi:fructokinase
LDWFLYAQLLNKNFEQTITIAQKISGVETETLRLPGGVNIQEYLNID